MQVKADLKTKEKISDLVLLDISMPHINGFKVLKAIRESRSFGNLPVIMLTASAKKEHLVKIREDIDDYVIKPPDRADLLTRIERILGGRPQFEEVVFNESDPLAQGSLALATRLTALSLTGLSFFSPLPLEKGHPLLDLTFPPLSELKLKFATFRVAECTPMTNGGFEIFVSFTGMSLSDQQRVRDWIISKTYQTKV